MYIIKQDRLQDECSTDFQLIVPYQPIILINRWLNLIDQKNLDDTAHSLGVLKLDHSKVEFINDR